MRTSRHRNTNTLHLEPLPGRFALCGVHPAQLEVISFGAWPFLTSPSRCNTCLWIAKTVLDDPSKAWWTTAHVRSGDTERELKSRGYVEQEIDRAMGRKVKRAA